MGKQLRPGSGLQPNSNKRYHSSTIPTHHQFSVHVDERQQTEDEYFDPSGQLKDSVAESESESKSDNSVKKRANVTGRKGLFNVSY